MFGLCCVCNCGACNAVSNDKLFQLSCCISMYQSMCAVPNTALLCSPFMSCLPAVLLRYFLDDLQAVSAAHIVTDITFVFTFQIHGISVARSLYFKVFTASVLITFLSPETARSGNLHDPLSYKELWCPVYCYGWFCRFSLVGFTMWLPYFHDLFLLIYYYYYYY